MIDQVIERLSETVPLLKLVGEAADFQSAVESNPKATPACYVFKTHEDPAAPMLVDFMAQEVTVGLAIVLVLRNVGSPKGAGTNVYLEMVRAAVKAQLYGWAPAQGMAPLARGSSHLLAFRDSYVWWQDIYKTSYTDRSEL